MTRENINRLLEGFAAGTLTEAERQALFEAALEDQQLFEALAREQALKDTLDDPRSRREVLAVLEERPRTWAWARAPWTWALAASVAASLVIGVVLVRWDTASRVQVAAKKQLAVEVARREAAPAPAAPPPAMPAPAQKAFRAPAVRQRSFSPPAAVPSAPERPAAAEPPALPPSLLDRPARAPAMESLPAAPPPAAADVAAARPVLSLHKESRLMRVSVQPSARDLYEAVAQPEASSEAGFRAAQPMPAGAVSTAHTLGIRYALMTDREPMVVDAPVPAGASLRLRLAVNERAWFYVIVGGRVLSSGIAGANQDQLVSVPAGTLGLKILASRGPVPSPVIEAGRSAAAMTERDGATVYAVQPGASQVAVEIILKYEEAR